jgi:branched-subunit amino acid transport protein
MSNTVNNTMNNSISTWLVIGLLTVVIFTSRNLFVIFGERLQPKGRFSQALDFAPLAALVAIVVPEFVSAIELHGASLPAHAADGRVLAGATAIIIGIATRNSLYALVAGAFCYFVLISNFIH